TQQKSAAGTCVDDSGIGSVAWSTPSNALTSDNSYATANFSSNGQASHYLKCTNFGFSVPSGGTIEGIQVEWEVNASSGGTIIDNAVRLVKGGTIGTADKSSSTSWPGSDTFRSYGGSSDLWSTSLTPSDVNATNFGAALSATITGGNSKPANVDSARITVS